MQEEITFILPTMNRRQYICRAVDSCLACHTEQVKPYVLIIDGKSDDGTYELLLERYGDNEQVRIIQYDRIGFQRTAYYGALQVSTKYATFMYDDDVLSPDFYKLFEEMLAQKKDFVMGFAAIYNVDEIFPFKPIQEFQLYPKFDLVLAYFGYARDLQQFVLPASPICCIVTTEHLKKWVHFSQEYAKGIAIRQYYMIDRNIGPDLILYFSSILKQDNAALVAPAVVGQLSEHPDSMSIGYGERHLITGYWFGNLWAFEEICRQGNKKAASQCAAFLLSLGGVMLLKMVSSEDRRWFWPFFREILKVVLMTFRCAKFFPLIQAFITTLRNYRSRRAHLNG